MLVFVQPFGLHSPGGGPRILRALLHDAPQPFMSVNTSSQPAPPTTVGREEHLPLRPHFGRIEGTRLSGVVGYADRLLVGRFTERLEQFCRSNGVTALHGLPHSLDFWSAWQVSRKLGIPYYLSVHDDPLYTLRGRPELRDFAAHIGEVWQGADARLVISEAMGREYNRRYGQRPYELVTDGLNSVPDAPLPRPPGSLRIYFMGLFHLCYGPNLQSLVRSLKRLRETQRDLPLSLTCRCAYIPPEFLDPDFPVTILPFASEQEVARDMETADLLYMPLPFGKEYELFVRFSLSTKMVTYLGSGLPILYHGPDDAAACALLEQHEAALLLTSRNVEEGARTLWEAPLRTQTVTENALRLGRSQFQMEAIRQRFWKALAETSLTV